MEDVTSPQQLPVDHAAAAWLTNITWPSSHFRGGKLSALTHRRYEYRPRQTKREFRFSVSCVFNRRRWYFRLAFVAVGCKAHVHVRYILVSPIFTHLGVPKISLQTLVMTCNVQRVLTVILWPLCSSVREAVPNIKQTYPKASVPSTARRLNRPISI